MQSNALFLGAQLHAEMTAADRFDIHPFTVTCMNSVRSICCNSINMCC